MNDKSLPRGLQMLGPVLMVVGVMLPWGPSPEARGLDGWGLLVLLAGIPALMWPWVAPETPSVWPIPAGLALIGGIGALGGWVAAWRAVPPEVSNPMLYIGKGPLFAMAGAALAGATLSGPLRGWQRALAAGGGFAWMVGIAMGLATGLAASGGSPAAAEGAPPIATGTPWIVVEVHPSGEIPTRIPTPPSAPAMTSPIPAPSATPGSDAAFGGADSVGLPTATPTAGWEPFAPPATPTASPEPPTPTAPAEGVETPAPSPAPTATSPLSPPPTPTLHP